MFSYFMIATVPKSAQHLHWLLLNAAFKYANLGSRKNDYLFANCKLKGTPVVLYDDRDQFDFESVSMPSTLVAQHLLIFCADSAKA